MIFPITFNSQEELDKAVSPLLASKETEVSNRFKGYVSPDDAAKLSKKITAHETTIADLTAKNKAYENSALKAKIAHEKGIPHELAERLRRSR